MSKNKIYFILLIFLFHSCAKDVFENKQELLNYVKDNESFCIKKKVNTAELSIEYKPTDLMVSHEIDFEANREMVLEQRLKYKKYIYFELNFKDNNDDVLINNASNKQKFGQLVNDLSFNLEKYVSLFNSSNDTLKIADYIYPRMYGYSKETTILLAFPREKKFLKSKFLYLTVRDFGLNTGEVKFKINTESIVYEPKIKYN